MPEELPPLPDEPREHPEAKIIHVPWNPLALAKEVQAFSDDTIEHTQEAKQNMLNAVWARALVLSAYAL